MAAAVGLPSLDLYLLSQLFLLVFCSRLVSILSKLYLSMDTYTTCMSYYHPSIKLNYIHTRLLAAVRACLSGQGRDGSGIVTPLKIFYPIGISVDNFFLSYNTLLFYPLPLNMSPWKV